MKTKPAESPLLPLKDAREAALFFVVAALCFLAGLAALTARATYGAAASWTAEVEGELTVSLSGADWSKAETAHALISSDPGVASARLFTKAEIDALLAPNFGSRGLPDSLPVPKLIAVTARPGASDLGIRLARTLKTQGYIAAVDEHAVWAGDVRRALAALRLGAFATVGLLGATAIAVIAFATHAALLARRDIVDVLHLSGARDRFIAQLFERRFWDMGLKAGLACALVALGAVAVAGFAAASQARSGLLPEIVLGPMDGLILIITPLVAGLAARLAARWAVLGALKAQA